MRSRLWIAEWIDLRRRPNAWWPCDPMRARNLANAMQVIHQQRAEDVELGRCFGVAPQGVIGYRLRSVETGAVVML